MTSDTILVRRTRRAHWRRQRCGPDLCMTRRIHIRASTTLVAVPRRENRINYELPFA